MTNEDKSQIKCKIECAEAFVWHLLNNKVCNESYDRRILLKMKDLLSEAVELLGETSKEL